VEDVDCIGLWVFLQNSVAVVIDFNEQNVRAVSKEGGLSDPWYTVQ
jgi:hypothetical protein